MKLRSQCAVGFFVLGFVAWTLGGAIAGEKKMKVGDKAPVLESVDENGKPWKSTDVLGKKILVLYFYPADFTGGCTKQACGFRDEIENLHKQNMEVVGVSGDSVKTHHLFKDHHKLNFTLLSDDKGTLAKIFGINVKKGGTSPAIDETGKKINMVRNVTLDRFTVVIDKQGTIVALDPVTDPAGDSKRIEDLVKKLAAK
jgi:peroxiredoxin Q/BCP